MKFLKSLLPLSVINLIPLLCVTLTLPESIPVHMNYKMEVDRYGSRWSVMFMGMLPILISLGIFIYWQVTKNNEKFEKNRKVEGIILPTIAALMIVISWLPVFIVKAGVYDSVITSNRLLSAIFFAIGLFMIITSNFMGVIKQNRHLGIRIPWTLKDETVWKKTHRLGGHTGVWGGIIICVLSIISFAYNMIALASIGMAIGVMLVTFIPIIYSFLLYKKLHR